MWYVWERYNDKSDLLATFRWAWLAKEFAENYYKDTFALLIITNKDERYPHVYNPKYKRFESFTMEER